MVRERLTLEDFPMVIPQVIAWGDMDSFQHVNNTVFFRYFENARIAYFQKAGISYENSTGMGPILASISCKFIRPVYFPATLLVGTGVYERSQKELKMNYGLFSEDGKTCFAVGDSSIAAFDYKEKKRAIIPSDWY